MKIEIPDIINEIKTELEFDNVSMGRIFGVSKNEIEDILGGKAPDQEVRGRIETIYSYYKEAMKNNKKKKTFLEKIHDYIPKVGKWD
jgi:hypothetical protein